MSPFPSHLIPPRSCAPKKSSKALPNFWLPTASQLTATHRKTPPQPPAALHKQPQQRAPNFAAHTKKHRKNMGCSSSLPSEVIPDPGPTEQCTFTVKSAGMFKGDDCFAYRGDQCINQIVAARRPPRHRRDASSMAWRCATPARWRGVVVYNFHPTSTRLTF